MGVKQGLCRRLHTRQVSCLSSLPSIEKASFPLSEYLAPAPSIFLLSGQDCQKIVYQLVFELCYPRQQTAECEGPCN